MTVYSQPDDDLDVCHVSSEGVIESIEVVLDDEGLLTASEPKRPRKDDSVGMPLILGLLANFFCKLRGCP